MAHSEMHENGLGIDKFIKGDEKSLAEQFGEMSKLAFASGAVEVKQKIINDNDECTCGSGVRFDLCCKPQKLAS